MTAPMPASETLAPSEPTAAGSERASAHTWRAFRRDPLGMISLGLLLLLVVIALAAPLIAPYPASYGPDVLRPPGAEHWFGTDATGRDLYARVVYGASQSIIGALVAVLVGLIVGTAIGLAAGALGGAVDEDHRNLRAIESETTRSMQQIDGLIGDLNAQIGRENGFLARERTNRTGPDFLPALHKELIEVISKYTKVNADDIKISLDRQGNLEVLDVNVVLPDA